MIDVVEESLDIQVDYPIKLPASLPRLPHCIQCRLPRPIAIRIRVEQRIYRRFQSRLHHHLRDPVRYSWNPQLPFSARCLRYFHRPHRRRKIAARRHPIPDPVQVPFQVPFEIRNRLLIDACRSLIGLYPFIRLQYLPLRNHKRLCLGHRLLPLLVDPLTSTPGPLAQTHRSTYPRIRTAIALRLWSTTPSLHPVSRTSSLLRVVPPLGAASVLSLLWFFHLNFSVYIGAEVPTFRSTAVQQTQATLMPDAAPPVNRFRRGCSRSNDSLRF